MREAPSGSKLPTFFRWCLGGMAAIASGSASRSASARGAYARTHGRAVRRRISPTTPAALEVECGTVPAAQEELLSRTPFLGDDGASARDADADADADGSAQDADADADAGERVLRLVVKLAMECGDISASQEDRLARAPFLGGNGEEAAGVFSTPPAQDQQSQPQQDRGGKGEPVITMCTQPFTQPPSSPTSSSPSESEHAWLLKPRKPRVCTRKIRGARIRTPTPSPSPSPSPNRCRSPSPDVDPLFKAFVMIPSAPLPPADGVDILMLARRRGIIFK